MSASPKKPKKSDEKPKVKNPVTTICIPYKTLETFLKAVRGCTREARLHIEDSKLSVKCVDTANVYMVRAECSCKTTMQPRSPDQIGIDLARLNKVFLYAKGCDITMEITGSKVSLKYGRFSSTFEGMDCNEIPKDPNGPPQMQLNEMSFPGKYLHEICRMSSKDGKIRLLVDNGVIMLRSEGDEISITEVVGTTDKKIEVNSLYSSDYLKDISESVKNTECTVKAGIDHPVHIITEVNDCKLQFLLAPRIEPD